METGRVISGCRFEWSPRFGILFGPTTRLILCSQNMRMPLELILNAGQGLFKLKLPNRVIGSLWGGQHIGVKCSLVTNLVTNSVTNSVTNLVITKR